MQTGGALAAKLDAKLDKHLPGWRDDPRCCAAHGLALIAADLDTANVAEPFPRSSRAPSAFVCEREMRSDRSLDAGEARSRCSAS